MAVQEQSVEKECADMWWLQHLSRETGETSSEWTTTRNSCSGSYQQLSSSGLDKQLLITDGEAGHHKKMIQTVNTNVVVLAVSVTRGLQKMKWG